jgi:hypothetical protein
MPTKVLPQTIASCVCGQHPKKVIGNGYPPGVSKRRRWVSCGNAECHISGPTSLTDEEAIIRWNKLMQPALYTKTFADENNKLRALLAKGQGDCAYCTLSAERIAECALGFPGCHRMDDMVNTIISTREAALEQQLLEADNVITELRQKDADSSMEF